MDNLINNALSLLGLQMRDKVTDYEGVVTSVSFDVAGCVQGLLTQKQPTESDNSKCRWFDVKRLEVVQGLPAHKTRVLEAPSFGVMPTGTETGPEPKPRFEGQRVPR